jgi:hypothetical protein
VFVLASVVGLLFICTGAVKLVGVPFSLAMRDHLGVSVNLWRIIGALEVLGGMGVIIGIAVEWLQILTYGCLAALMVGALMYRFRAKDGIVWIGADLGTLAFVVVAAVLRITGH